MAQPFDQLYIITPFWLLPWSSSRAALQRPPLFRRPSLINGGWTFNPFNAPVNLLSKMLEYIICSPLIAMTVSFYFKSFLFPVKYYSIVYGKSVFLKSNGFFFLGAFKKLKSTKTRKTFMMWYENWKQQYVISISNITHLHVYEITRCWKTV